MYLRVRLWGGGSRRGSAFHWHLQYNGCIMEGVGISKTMFHLHVVERPHPDDPVRAAGDDDILPVPLSPLALGHTKNLHSMIVTDDSFTTEHL